jgi:FAD/FMN-containing dehydrogenase
MGRPMSPVQSARAANGASESPRDGTRDAFLPTRALLQRIDSGRRLADRPAMPIDVPGLAKLTATTWTDWIGFQSQTAFLVTPKDRHELVAMLRATPSLEKVRLRAYGGRHSTSPVAQPQKQEFVVDFRRFTLDHAESAPSWLRDDWDHASTGKIEAHASLVRTHAGLHVYDLNGQLWFGDPGNRRALANLGSYDHQTIYGAIATGTHGTGSMSGPLADFVVSMEMVVVVPDAAGKPVVKSLRVEPTNGVTDRAKFEAAAIKHGMELVNDDDLFYSAVVGIGCFGIVTAVTLQVVPSFWLAEERWTLPWSVLKKTLLHDAKAAEHYDFILSTEPLNRNGSYEHQCLVTRRTRTAPGNEPAPPRNDARIEALEARFKQHHSSAEELTRSLSHLAAIAPNIGADLVYGQGFEAEADRKPIGGGWKSRSSIVFRQSTGDYTLAASAEVGVPIEKAVEAIDAVIAHCAALRPHDYFHTSPFGVRFQKDSKHFLSMQHERWTCTIEAPLLKYTRRRWHDAGDAPHSIAHIHQSFLAALTTPALKGRPHWGQTQFVDRAQARAMYSRFESPANPNDPKTWLGQYRRYNAFGIFDNAFTDTLGVSHG